MTLFSVQRPTPYPTPARRCCLLLICRWLSGFPEDGYFYGPFSYGRVWVFPNLDEVMSSAVGYSRCIGGRPGVARGQGRGSPESSLQDGRSGLGFGRILAVYSRCAALVMYWLRALRAVLLHWCCACTTGASTVPVQHQCSSGGAAVPLWYLCTARVPIHYRCTAVLV